MAIGGKSPIILSLAADDAAIHRCRASFNKGGVLCNRALKTPSRE